MAVMEQNMNKKSDAPCRPPAEVGSGRPATRVGSGLTREASRLLALLAEPGAYALPDPLAERGLLVRRGGDGISVGSGRFAWETGESLLDADLAERSPTGGRLTISAAGRARLRRMAAAGGTPFLAQHLDLTRTDGDVGGDAPLRDASENPLAWMARRRGSDGAPLIDAAAFEAGERLRRDITLAAMLPRMGMDWGTPRVDGGGPRDPAGASNRVLAARQRVRGALDAVGMDLSGLLIDLCGFLKGLERIEAERRWPARSAKVVARIALGRLAEHYGLEREAVGPDRARMRLWREEA